MSGPVSYRSSFLLFILLLLLSGAVSGHCEQAPVRSIRVVMDNNYPPFAFLDNGGNLQGILVDQWRLWEKKTGIRVELHGMDWSKALLRMQSGEFDVIDTIFKTAQRLEQFDFTPPYQKIEVPIFFENDITGITDAASLKGFPVGVKDGDAAIELLARQGVTGLIPFSSYEAIIQAAKEHRINVFVADKPPALYFLNKYALSGQIRSSTPLTVGELHRAVRKGNRELLGVVEQGFAKIATTEYQDIERKWYGSNLIGAASLKYGAYGSIAAGCIIIMLVIWNSTLRRAVFIRTKDLILREQQLRLIFDVSQAGIIMVNPEGIITFANKRMAEMFACTLERLIGSGYTEHLHPDQRFPGDSGMRRLIAGEIEYVYTERHYVRADGTDFWGYLSGRRHEAPDGSLVSLVGVIADITELKRAEEAAREKENRYRVLFESANDGIFLQDATGFLDCNQRGADMYGLPKEEIIGRSPADFCPEKQPDGRLSSEVAAEKIQAAMGGEPQVFEWQPLRADGVPFDVEITLNRLELGGSVCLLAVVRDITERIELQREREKNQRLESLGLFAGGIAHDFNNILTGILGNVSFARMLVGDDHKAAARLVDCEKAAKRASDLTRQLMTFARGGDPVKVPVGTKKLVEESLAFVLRGTGVKGVVECQTDIWRMDADPGQMSQVFNNLLINARQAMPDSGTVTIAIENHEVHGGDPLPVEPGRYVRVVVTDQGAGIAPEHLAKIFDPYFTTKAEGSGLGLASVYSIVKRHGGMVTVTSQPGKGSAFTLLIPATRDTASDIQEEERKASSLQGEGRILVMDDEELIRDVAVATLNELGYVAEACEDGHAAVALHAAARDEGRPYAAIILDMTIPGGMGGREAAALIREEDPEVALIVSSGYSNDTIVSEYHKHGFAGVVMKPYSLEGLAGEVDRVLRERRTP